MAVFKQLSHYCLIGVCSRIHPNYLLYILESSLFILEYSYKVDDAFRIKSFDNPIDDEVISAGAPTIGESADLGSRPILGRYCSVWLAILDKLVRP